MSKATENFKSFIINEYWNGGRKGSEQAGVLSEDWTKPEVLRVKLTSRGVSLYDEPEQAGGAGSDISPEELTQLQSLGLDTSSKIESWDTDYCIVEYDIVPLWTRTGIQELAVLPKKIEFAGGYTVWNEEKQEEDWIDFKFVDDQIGIRYRWDDAKYMFPFEITSLDIRMNRSFDHTKFTYEFTVGNWQDD